MNQLVKERLTGAIILVALIVLLVPELLTGPLRPARASAASGSSAEEPPLRSYTISLSDEAHAQAPSSGPEMPQSGSQDQAASGTQPSVPGPPATTVAPPPSGNPTAQHVAPAPAAPASAAPTQRPTSRTAKAAHASALSASSEPSRSSASGTGWMVQLGVFASRENAEHLAQEMRGKGFKASVSDVTSSSRRLYRVRVGPAPDRAAAQTLQGRLRAAGRSGTLVPLS